jgi:hypothetical protein
MGPTPIEHKGRHSLHCQDENVCPKDGFRDHPDGHGQDSVPSFDKTDRKKDANERHPKHAETSPNRSPADLAFPFVCGLVIESAPAGNRESSQSQKGKYRANSRVVSKKGEKDPIRNYSQRHYPQHPASPFFRI